MYADAAARWHAFVMPYEEAQALCGRARCLVELGRRSEAEQQSVEARTILVRLGAAPAIREVDGLLAD